MMTSPSQAPVDRCAEWHHEWESGAMDEFAVNKPHPKLEQFYNQIINMDRSIRILFPLCGDSHDMIWLSNKGHTIVGVECSERGIKTFLNKHNLKYRQDPCPAVKGSLFTCEERDFKLYCCDIFNFSESVEKKFDIIWDFGSMGALLRPDLKGYATIMKSLLDPAGKHIVEFFVYDLDKYPAGRPNYLTMEPMQELFGDECKVEVIEVGPNPYADDYSEPESATTNDVADAGKHQTEEECSDMVPFNALTAAIYYKITKA